MKWLRLCLKLPCLSRCPCFRLPFLCVRSLVFSACPFTQPLPFGALWRTRWRGVWEGSWFPVAVAQASEALPPFLHPSTLFTCWHVVYIHWEHIYISSRYNLHTLKETDLRCSSRWVWQWLMTLNPRQGLEHRQHSRKFLGTFTSQLPPHTPRDNHFLIYTNLDLSCLLRFMWIRSYNTCFLVSGIFSST